MIAYRIKKKKHLTSFLLAVWYGAIAAAAAAVAAVAAAVYPVRRTFAWLYAPQSTINFYSMRADTY